MKFKRIWRGMFPKYWDVTMWAILLQQHVVFCHRNENTNRRIIMKIEIDSGETTTVQTIYNSILGSRNNIVFLARISDARSHLKIDRIGAFDVNYMSFRWEIDEAVIVEKYKVPTINEFTGDWCTIGNKKIYLNDGRLLINRKLTDCYWPVDENLSLVQKNDVLACVDSNGITIWEYQGYFGSHFQGTFGEQLIFFTPLNELVILNKLTGGKIEEICLLQARLTTRRIFGNFEVFNSHSFENTTIADGVVNENIVAWIDENYAFNITNRQTKTVKTFSYPNSSIPYLSQINKEELLIFELENEDYGSLVIGTLEE
ncbi:hypothetical protein SD70_14835 [Gordoniibacillus kamchatkensis]|uniref:Uncharacterized protein n=1 Tax=Gordoniibacillus kamchatkensis TaxID=1590651 RepID=A0ABR5AGY6_9BACL|nr:hypothetical protein [Paenibacillus sp. VKM B-2647]KIL40236.1 hypothetical protein SD70_14835 [Paenibacillus sp. VKM B-2647]